MNDYATTHFDVRNRFPWVLKYNHIVHMRGGSDKANSVGETRGDNKPTDSSKVEHLEEDFVSKLSDWQEQNDTEKRQSVQTSYSFLSTPIRMNELARHEASMTTQVVTKEIENNVVEKKDEIVTASVVSSGSGIVVEDEKKVKRKKKKRGQLNEKVNNNKSNKEQTIKIITNKTAATDRKATEHELGKFGNTIDDFNEYGDPKMNKTASKNSKSLWWDDVWMQQFSDSKDFEEGKDGFDDIDDTLSNEEQRENMKSNLNYTIQDSSEKEKAKKKFERHKSSSFISENRVHYDSDSDGNVTISKISTINDTTQLSDEELTTILNFTIVSESVSYVSSGAWVFIDNMLTLGLASKVPFLRLSRNMRGVRKLTAQFTGLHGLLSRKPSSPPSIEEGGDTTEETILSKDSNQRIQKRLVAIEKAREGVERAQAIERDLGKRRKGLLGGIFALKVDEDTIGDPTKDKPLEESISRQERKRPQKSAKDIEEELKRMERVRDIDRLISEGQTRLTDLICEKDVLQRRPNPLFDYTSTKETITAEIDIIQAATTEHSSSNETEFNVTSETDTVTSKIEFQTSRKMNFPPDDLVAEYLDMIISTRRLTKMNHTYLWKDAELVNDDDEESIGDDLFTASADAHRLYDTKYPINSSRNGKSNDSGKKGGGGSWLLRQSIGGGRSLGEKIGAAVETAAYRAVTSALMSFLARAISSLHGINVLKHSDIRLVLEQSPDLPFPKDGIIRGSYDTYAEDTIKTVMRRKARRSKKRSKHRLSEDAFVQRDAVTETLLSHVQISAPLLKLFPLAWQRALLGNILTLSTALISDFVDGLHFQILGHQLSFAFRPITEIDMARHFQMAGGRFNQRRYKAAEFEAAIKATAEDLKEELQFLDSWHERALGSGVLRTQIANMIARIVLTLTDEILSGARMDLWSAQAGGPRMLAGLEHRIEEEC